MEASGWPGWVKSEEDKQVFIREHQQRLDIAIDKNSMNKNPGRKQLAKLMLNSLWGKFAQNQQLIKDMLISSNDQATFDALEDDWDNGKVDFVWRTDTTNKTYFVLKMLVERENMDSGYNVAIAAFVTAQARLRLWREMNKLGPRVIYHDTDSVIYEHSPTGYNIPDGRYLGEWEDETGGQPITAFVSAGPKTYSYKYLGKPEPYSFQREEEMRKMNLEYMLKEQKLVPIKCSTKAKGFTLNYDATGRINFDSMHALILGNVEYLESFGPVFEYNRLKSIITYNAGKKLKWCYNKGLVIDMKVYPFGTSFDVHGAPSVNGRGSKYPSTGGVDGGDWIEVDAAEDV